MGHCRYDDDGYYERGYCYGYSDEIVTEYVDIVMDILMKFVTERTLRLNGRRVAIYDIYGTDNEVMGTE